MRSSKKKGISFSEVITEHQNHATELTYKAALLGQRNFISVGGDGTVHEVLNGIMKYSDETGIPSEMQIQNRSAILDSSSKTKKGRIAPSNKINYFCFAMYKQLTSEQRYAIGLMLKQNCSQKFIAGMLKVHPSTISREIKRNKSKRGRYNSVYAQECANERRFRLPGNRSLPDSVKRTALRYLETEQWSPKQISGYLSLSGVKISHETIYSIIRTDKANGGTLYKNCRHGLKHRRRCKWFSGGISDRTPISERPSEADERRFGDWEMDTIVGKGNVGAIVTLTERSTNFLLIPLPTHIRLGRRGR